MITGINYLRIFSVMITDWETNFTDLQANDFGNLGKNNSGNILVGNHAVIFTEINSPRIFFWSVMFVWTMVFSLASCCLLLSSKFTTSRHGTCSDACIVAYIAVDLRSESANCSENASHRKAATWLGRPRPKSGTAPEDRGVQLYL